MDTTTKKRYTELRYMAEGSAYEKEYWSEDDGGHEYKGFWVTPTPRTKCTFTSDAQVDEFKRLNREVSKERIAKRIADGEPVGYGSIGIRKAS